MGIKRPVMGVDDLRTLNPVVAGEWFAEKNEGLNIADYVAGSAKRVWWKCSSCEHEWQTSIRARYQRGTGCPLCARIESGRKRVATEISRKGCFSDAELLRDWDWEKNAPSVPSDFTPASNSKVHWRCHVCGYLWAAKIGNRVHGRGCPACAGKALYVGHNDFATTEPELAKEWHPTKNGTLSPTDVMRGEARKVWWLCPKGHSYEASLNKRTSDRTGCPICNSGRQTSFREQAFYYYIQKIYPGACSRYKPDWLGRMELDIYIPEKKLAIEYDGAAWHKASKFDRERKKYELCHAHGVTLWRVKETMPEEVRGLADKVFSVPDVEVKDGFKRLLSWILDELDPASNFWTRGNPLKFHSDVDVDLDRDRYEINHYRFSIKNSLAERCPEIAAEWHPTKNPNWLPTALPWRSERKVWWLCPKCGNEYEMTVAHRTDGSGCPKCAKEKFQKTYRQNRIAKVGSLSDKRLLAEWDYEKNGTLRPEQFSPGCEDKVWWKCQDCGHSWLAKIANRTHGRGCPCCSNHVLVKGKNDLQTLFPDLCKEWDWNKNEDLRPDQVLPGRNAKVWWICPKCGYSYAAPPVRRTRCGSGCRKCADKENWTIRRANAAKRQKTTGVPIQMELNLSERGAYENVL